MRKYIKIVNEAEQDERCRAFEELADAQRGEPEMAMLRVQHAMSGGVLSPVVEHCGDLTHRMAQYPDRADYYSGYELVKEKVDRCLRYLTSPYGFEREMKQNIVTNARYHNIPEDKFITRLDRALAQYADEHSKLHVYNRAQWLARQAAVAVGLKQFDLATRCLQLLSDHLNNREEWNEFASPYDPDFKNA